MKEDRNYETIKVQVSWVYNGRDDLASSSSVGLFYRELPAALKVADDSGMADLFAEVHEQVRDGLHYVFDYAASRYEEQTILNFREMFRRTVSVILTTPRPESLTFHQLKKEVKAGRSIWGTLKSYLGSFKK